MREMIQTERDYVRSLAYIIEVFKKLKFSYLLLSPSLSFYGKLLWLTDQTMARCLVLQPQN